MCSTVLSKWTTRFVNHGFFFFPNILRFQLLSAIDLRGLIGNATVSEKLTSEEMRGNTVPFKRLILYF